MHPSRETTLILHAEATPVAPGMQDPGAPCRRLSPLPAFLLAACRICPGLVAEARLGTSIRPPLVIRFLFCFIPFSHLRVSSFYPGSWLLLASFIAPRPETAQNREMLYSMYRYLRTLDRVLISSEKYQGGFGAFQPLQHRTMQVHPGLAAMLVWVSSPEP